MDTFYWEPEWLDIVRRQEKLLVFKRFSREDALKIGLSIIGLVQERYHNNGAIAILEGCSTVFSYKMPGTSLENEWWMRRKLNAAQRSGRSSMLAGLEQQYCPGKSAPLPDALEQKDLAFCGGCFPIRMENGSLYGYILVSGLEHYNDHQVIADALSSHLNVQTPNVAAAK